MSHDINVRVLIARGCYTTTPGLLHGGTDRGVPPALEGILAATVKFVAVVNMRFHVLAARNKSNAIIRICFQNPTEKLTTGE